MIPLAKFSNKGSYYFFMLATIILSLLPLESYAKEKISFEIVNIKKYITDHYKYKHKLPLFTMAIKNTGGTPITSRKLDCDVSFIDIDNKRIIAEYGRNLLNEFKTIDPGFTSSLIAIDILRVGEKIVNVIGQRPIDFKMKAKIECSFQGYAKEKKVIFSPTEYRLLPLWN